VNAFALQLIKNSLTIPKTFSQLKNETKIAERTLRYNLSILKRKNIVKEVPVLWDLRRKLFYIER